MTAPLPAGTVTILFTDIEGSTALLRRLGDGYDAVLATHFERLRPAIASQGGVEVNTEGDALLAVFRSAPDAVVACVDAQRALASGAWPRGVQVRVRMGLHTGEVRVSHGDYIGLAIHQASRVVNTAHGGQIVCSAATAAACETLPPDVQLLPLGEFDVRDFEGSEELHQVVAPGIDALFPALRAVRSARHNIPAERTTFIGREAELEEMAKLVEQSQAITVVGPGGAGKTRVTYEIGRRCAQRFADGVLVVPLAPVEDPERVVDRFSDLAGLRNEPGRSITDTLVAAFAHRQLLLILDNCEHVVSAVARLVDEITRNAPGVVVVASSRRPLNIAGEAVFRLPPLGVDATLPADELAASDAVRLFVDRAMRSDARFELTPGSLAAVARVCGLVDGLPLGIELAASRLRSLSLRDVEARLVDRLRLLAGGPRDADSRQQSLRATIEWSVALLSDAERKLMARLSIFAGGATIAAVEMVGEGATGSDDVIDVVSSLVDNSVVRLDVGPAGSRYRMLETIREYAAELLRADAIEERSTRARFVEWAIGCVEPAAARLSSAEAKDAVELLAAEHDNLVVALETAVANPHDERSAERIAFALADYWQVAGLWSVATEHLGRMPEPSEVQDRALLALRIATIAELQGDFGSATTGFDQALALSQTCGDHATEARAQMGAASILVPAGDLEGARRRLEAAMAAAILAGDDVLIAGIDCQAVGLDVDRVGLDVVRDRMAAVLAVARQRRERRLEVEALSQMVWMAEDVATAIRLGEQCRRISREMGDRGHEAQALFMLAHMHRIAADDRVPGALDDARRCGEEALALARRLGARQLQAVILGKLGNVAYAAKDYKGATRRYHGVLEVVGQLGHRMLELKTYQDLGWAQACDGDLDAAASWFTAALEVARELGLSSDESEVLSLLAAVAAGKGDYPAAVAWRRAQAKVAHGLTADATLARALAALGDALVAAGDLVTAAVTLGRAVELAEACGDGRARFQALCASAHCAREVGDIAAVGRNLVSAFAMAGAVTIPSAAAHLAWFAAELAVDVDPRRAAILTGAAARMDEERIHPVWWVGPQALARRVDVDATIDRMLAEEAAAFRERGATMGFDELAAEVATALRCEAESER